jgi:hypothetical protein
MSDALPQSDPLAVAESVSEAMVRQPDLFAGGEAFSSSELEMVRHARKGRYNGAVTTRSEARVALVVALRQQGCSLREIQRRTGMDTRLVVVVLREAEKSGVVPALKEVLTRRMAETTERALDRLDEELDREEPDHQLVRALGVVAGIGADKMTAAGTGGPDLHLHQHVHLAGADPARDYLMKRAAVLATESESAQPPTDSTPILADVDAAAVLAAPVGSRTDSSPDPGSNPAPASNTPATPGGGSPILAPGATP